MSDIDVQLIGHFNVCDKEGTNLTPSSLKAQAVMALIATSKNLHRTRSWLQDKLWSDKDQDKSSANLRQSLTTIRRSLGPFAEVLQSNRHSVWLEAERVDIDWRPGSKPPTDGVFLEGIDIDDPEFHEWLQIMRAEAGPSQAVTSSYANIGQAVTPQKWRIHLAAEEGSVSTAAFIENELINLMFRNISEYSNMEVLLDPVSDPDEFTFDIRVAAVHLGDNQLALKITARHSLTRRAFWNETALSEGKSRSLDENFNLLGLSFSVLTALGKEIALHQDKSTETTRNNFLLSSLIPKIFSFQPGKVAHAEDVLEALYDERLLATNLGWRAQISVIKNVERFGGDPENYVGAGRLLAAKAIEADAMNSMALATAANASVTLDRDTTTASELAQLAVRVNPANPFSWSAYSNVALYCQESEKAVKAARMVEQLVGNTALQFWCKCQLGLAAFQVGNLDLATRSFETSAALAPHFRPPRRYLLALYLHQGDVDRARRVVVQLQGLEQDFSLDRFFNDPTYPISLARSVDWMDLNALASVLD